MLSVKKKSIFKFLVGFVLFIVLVALDQYTKNIATMSLKNQAPFVIIKDVLEFNYLDGGNTGAAWGILSGQISFFIILTVIVCIVLCGVLCKIESEIMKDRSVSKKFTLLQFLLLMLISGAVGNLIDRACYGYVVDFIYFKLINFPIFNVADCYVTISAFSLIIFSIFFMSDEEFAKAFYFKINKKKEKEKVED